MKIRISGLKIYSVAVESLGYLGSNPGSTA